MPVYHRSLHAIKVLTVFSQHIYTGRVLGESNGTRGVLSHLQVNEKDLVCFSLSLIKLLIARCERQTWSQFGGVENEKHKQKT